MSEPRYLGCYDFKIGGAGDGVGAGLLICCRERTQRIHRVFPHLTPALPHPQPLSNRIGEGGVGPPSAGAEREKGRPPLCDLCVLLRQKV